MLYDAAIIGAGPAGLLCALHAARRGLRVALADSHTSPGGKLPITGGGKGNVTNSIVMENRYLGENTGILRAILRSFTCDDALSLMRETRFPVEVRDFGQIFGLRPAKFLAEQLATQCANAGVDFYFGKAVKRIIFPVDASGHAIEEKNGEFLLFAEHERIKARQLVLACGSPACPQMGGNDRLARQAASWGHTLIPFRPVLVPLLMPKNWPLGGLAGISLNVRIGIRHDHIVSWPDPEGIRPLLFTHRGISGPAALTISCWWRPGEELLIDFLPEIPISALLNAEGHGKVLVKNLLSRHMPARLVKAICPNDVSRRKVAELGKNERMLLADACHRYSVFPTGTGGMGQAEAAAGGIALSSLSRHLESLRIPGLYFCGEMVDITGLLGGYNIHWAFASGHMVGNALKKLPSQKDDAMF